MAQSTGKLLLLCIFVQLYDWTGALKLTKFLIPAYVQKGSSASLVCQYVLDAGESLYTLKWYKDGVEFYRFEPGAQPSQKIFPQSGVQVNLSLSNDTYVTLQPANRRYTGRYMCEVSGEAPKFDTAEANDTMHVIVLPTHGVEITTAGGVPLGTSSDGKPGTERGYRVGDVVVANCTCRRTAPVARLTWFLNDEEVSIQHLEIYTPHVEEGSYGLTSVTLGLHFRSRAAHFRSSSGQLRIKCVAALPDLQQPMFLLSRQVSLLLYDGPEVSRVVHKSRAASTADGVNCCSLCCHIANWLILTIGLYLSI